MTVLEPRDAIDSCDVSLVYGMGDEARLEVFNRAGVLGPADVHTAIRLARLGGESDPLVALAVALAVRAPRVGHVSVDLATVRTVAGADAGEDVDIDALPWPEPTGWLEQVAASPLVALGETDADRPLRLIDTSLYLDRYWRDEMTVAADLRARAGAAPPPTDEVALAGSLARLFDDGAGDQDQLGAVAMAVGRRFTVIAGGPGTGKTTTVARLLAVIHDQAAAFDERPPLVGLAAPTGKAAARLEDAVRAEAARLLVSGTVPAEVAERLAGIGGSTLHRLLGSRPGTSRYRYHRGLRLPHDVIVVDEASMISLAIMARLVEAVRPDARLVLVGDPEQLVSVEAGAVLADVVGPAAVGEAPAGTASAGTASAATASGATSGEAAAGKGTAGEAPATDSPMAGSVARLRTNHRFSGALAELAAAVQTGDDDQVIDILGRGDSSLAWLDHEAGTSSGLLRGPITEWTGRLVETARQGDRTGALQELSRHRLLCAHRRGADGVSEWNGLIERWLAEDWPDLAGEGAWYAGRPVMVTSNDYNMRLFNGDTGVTVAGGVAVAGPDDTGPRVSVVFEDAGGSPRPVSPSRLADVETVYAMTIHKSQGSEFDRVTLLLPLSTSRLLTRELFYTAITRARQGLLVVGAEDAIRVAVNRRIARASGLADRLWGRG